ncbi:MAG: hypothetical protein ACHQF0_02605 [Chitinophagales bacterium]
MKKKFRYIFLSIISIFLTICLFAQDPPPNDANAAGSGGIATAAGRLASTPVNFYTGMPDISIPIYHYTNRNGLSLSISLVYADAGGVKVNETPTNVGLGWYLNAGGVITRTVRGMPDDISTNGFMYASAIPGDYRPNGSKYYHDSLDAEQDIFQYNFNGRSGKFFIGKNKQIIAVPLSKLRIGYTALANSPITSFNIITEEGIKYVFSDIESEANTVLGIACGYNGATYNSAWYLSQIISPMGTDTIRFSYSTIHETNATVYPQTIYIKNSDGSSYRAYSPTGSANIYVRKISSIIFPDKKIVSFIYDRSKKYDGTDSVLNRIKISDSVFRYGYLFDWNCCDGDSIPNRRSFLNGIRFFTNNRTIPGYQFLYTGTLFPAFGTSGDTLGNKRDHWGFYNTANNGTNVIPTVTGIYNGANRNPSSISAVSSALTMIHDPSGGSTYYSYEPNDILQINSSRETVAINALNNTSTNISLSQAFNTRYTFSFSFDPSFSRAGSPPFSGSCNLVCNITSTDGLTNYATASISLYQLFYVGSVSFSFNVTNGNYKIQTSLQSCTVTPPSIPVNIAWQNQTIAGTATTMGGIRIKSISHSDPTTGSSDTIATYKYIKTDGSSSGFLQTIPVYNYPYQETVINGGTTTTGYTAISSDPINNLNYTQGSPVGYSRVIVYRGSETHNLGKTVYDFTDLQDANFNITQPVFPYAPITQPDWALGQPKKISVYDSLGRLVKVTQNTFIPTTITYNSSDFTSLRLGKTSVTFNGDPNNPNTPYTEYYTGQNYYQQTGRSDLATSIDSIFHPDGSIQVRQQAIQYDSDYNVIKITSPYDLNRSLSLEQRFYYPYNYTLSSGAIKKMRDNSIISPVISTESWITGDANPRMIGARITDYQQLTRGHIKPLTLYAFQSNAPVPQSVIGSFNPASLVRNSTYLVAQQNFVTYDSVGNLLETKNSLSGQSNSVVMDYFSQFPVAKVANASAANTAYTSFESDGKGNWTIPSTLKNATASLTGKYCYDLANGSISKSGLTSAVTYIVSVWVKTGGSPTINGSVLSNPIASHNGWNFYSKTVSGVTTITVGGSGLIDELRLYPKDASMTTFTYEPLIGVTSIADANSTVNFYLYDSVNRLKIIKDKDLNVLKQYDYSDSDKVISLLPNWHPKKSIGGSNLYVCEAPLNGRMDRVEIDMNPYSETYNVTRQVFDHNDCIGCAPACTVEGQKWLNCTCENGTRVNTSVVQIKVNGVWLWRCTYHYEWSDCSISGNYTQDSSSPCTLNNGPCEL